MSGIGMYVRVYVCMYLPTYHLSDLPIMYLLVC